MFKNSQTKIWIILFIVLFFLFIFWSTRSVHLVQEKINKENEISQKYQKIIKLINIQDKSNLNKIENFILNNHNIYGTLTAMILAKQYISHNNLQKAIEQLTNSLKYTKEEIFQDLLTLKIAKLKIENKQDKDALKILKNVKNYFWRNILNDTKGDIFKNLGFFKEAIKSWKLSKNIEKSDISKKILDMKIKNLKKQMK